jgi:RNA polymerase sigma factor (sigma-70 family)
MESKHNRVIDEFLKFPDNKILFDEFQSTKDEKVKALIDERFKLFYQRYRIISYLIKVLHYESKHFDKKIRLHNDRNQLVLSSNPNLLEIEKQNENDSLEVSSHSIVDHITDEKLLASVRRLTDRQQQVLSLAFIQQMSDTEIALHLGVTQQAVSKAKKISINKIREELKHV